MIRIAVFCFAAFVAVASMAVLRGELAAVSVLRDLRAQPVQLGPSEALPRVWTSGPAQALTLECLDVFAPDIRALLPVRIAKRSHAACLDMAQWMIRSRPSDGRGPLLKAALAAQDGTLDEQLHYLQIAADLAPFEGWQAERRLVALFALDRDVLNDAQTRRVTALVHNAVSVAVTTQSGAELLADYFIRRPHLRPVLTAGFAGATAENRTRIVNLIRIRGDV